MCKHCLGSSVAWEGIKVKILHKGSAEPITVTLYWPNYFLSTFLFLPASFAFRFASHLFICGFILLWDCLLCLQQGGAGAEKWMATPLQFHSACFAVNEWSYLAATCLCEIMCACQPFTHQWITTLKILCSALRQILGLGFKEVQCLGGLKLQQFSF